jgi:hypothetical protein
LDLENDPRRRDSGLYVDCGWRQVNLALEEKKVRSSVFKYVVETEAKAMAGPDVVQVEAN